MNQERTRENSRVCHVAQSRRQRRAIKCAVMLAGTCGIVSVQRTARADMPRLGLSLDYREAMRSYELPGGDVLDHYDAVGGTLFADWRYLRLGLGMSHNFGNLIVFTDGREEKDPDYSIGYLHAHSWLKYPFDFSRVGLSLWPTLGLRLDYNLTYEYTGSGQHMTDSSADDLSLVGGVGLDYSLGSRVALTTALLGGYCLTPSASGSAQSTRLFDVALSAGAMLTL